MLVESVTISRRDFDAAIFDLDGVLTDTAGVHAAAWKAVFDSVPAEVDARAWSGLSAVRYRN